MIDLAKKTLIEGGYSAVVVKNNKVLHAVMGSGVYPVIKLYNEYPEDMKDAVVADKIIGSLKPELILLLIVLHSCPGTHLF